MVLRNHESIISYRTGFPLVGERSHPSHPTTQKTGLSPMLTPLICPQNFDFKIFMQFLAILSQLSPRHKSNLLGKPCRRTLELKEHYLNKVCAICRKLFNQLLSNRPKNCLAIVYFFQKELPQLFIFTISYKKRV